MAGKHRKEKIVHAPTKRQLSHWDKQKRQARIIKICAAVLIVAVIGVIVGGIYIEQVMPYQKTVIKVNDAAYDFDYYSNMLDAITTGVPNAQISYYTDIAAQAIAQCQLVRQKGPDVGLTVTDEEIKKEIEEDKLPDNAVGTDLASTRVLTKKYAEQVCTPKIPKTVEQAEVEAMFLDSKAIVEEQKNKLQLGENFTTMASQFSVEPNSKASGGYLGWIPRGYEEYAFSKINGAVFKDVIFTLKPGSYSDAIYDSSIEKSYGFWVLQFLEKDDARGYHGKGILLPTQAQAEDIRTQLLNGGNWDELAKQYSQATGKESGADLGWIQPGTDEKMLVRILAAQEPNKISDAMRDDTVKTSGGYWLVHVKDIQERPLPASIVQSVTQKCLGDWVEGLVKDARIENLLDEQQKNLAVQKISKTRGK